MVIEDKAIIGKLKKFSSRIQEFFSLGSNLSSCQTSGLFLPFGCTGDINGEQNDPNKYQSHGNTSEPYGSGEINKHRPPLSQTFPQWKVMCDVQKIHSSQQRKRFKKRTMYILPLGSLHEKEKVDRLINEYNQENVMYSVTLLHVIIEFMSLFFYGMKIKLLAFQNINSLGFKTRVHDRSGKKQVLVTDILDYLKKVRPSDSFCIVGWSSLDLYPSPELNFVLGEACFDNGCAVISFGYYADAAKPGADNTTDTMNNDKMQNTNETSYAGACDSCLSIVYPHWNCTDLGDKIVWRVLKVIVHEACHLLGMHHCTFFACLMNESSNVVQAQNQPLFLCPVCLRKLHKFLQFPIVTRYKMLKDFMEHHCEIIARKRQCSVSCLTDSIECNVSECLCEVGGLDSTDRITYEAYTLQKFKKSLKWLNNVLTFIS